MNKLQSWFWLVFTFHAIYFMAIVKSVDQILYNIVSFSCTYPHTHGTLTYEYQ